MNPLLNIFPRFIIILPLILIECLCDSAPDQPRRDHQTIHWHKSSARTEKAGDSDQNNLYHYPTVAKLRSYGIGCYSCMSRFYEEHWNTLSRMYNRPVNFTSHCAFDEIHRSLAESIGTVRCDSACVTIIERSEIGGVYITGYIRGCYDKLLLRGIPSRIITDFEMTRKKNECRQFSKREVLNVGSGFPDGKVTLCLCARPSKCNSTAGTNKRWLVWLLLGFIMFTRQLA